MEEYDPKKAIDGLAYFVGQALAALAGEDEHKQTILERAVDYHLREAANPSIRRTMKAVDLGAHRMAKTIRKATLQHEPFEE